MLLCDASFDNILSTDYIQFYVKRGKKKLNSEIVECHDAHYLAVSKCCFLNTLRIQTMLHEVRACFNQNPQFLSTLSC